MSPRSTIGTTDTITASYTYACSLKQTSETETVTDLGFISSAQNSRTEYSYQNGIHVSAETTNTEDGEVLSVSQTTYTHAHNGLLHEENTAGDDGSAKRCKILTMLPVSLRRLSIRIHRQSIPPIQRKSMKTSCRYPQGTGRTAVCL